MEIPYQNLVEMQESACEKFKHRELFGTKGESGVYEWIKYGEFAELVNHFRGGLASLGVVEGDVVAIISGNSTKWAIGAYASYGLQAQYIAMYENQSLKEWEYIINDSGTKILLVSNKEIYEKVKGLTKSIEALQSIVLLNETTRGAKTYDQLIEQGKKHPVASQKAKFESTMGMIYTSGTTGNPKGVVLSHKNMLSAVFSGISMLDFSQEDRTLCFLPWAHIFGQVAELHLVIQVGMSAGFAESVPQLIENLSEVQPSILFSVPRVFNKIYDGVMKKMNDDGGLAKMLFEIGMKRATMKRNGESLGFIDSFLLNLVDKIVFSKIRARFGGRLRYAFSGGAALSKEVGEFIDNLGIMVYEGYGLSETTALSCANSKHGRKIGSIGKPAPGVTIKLDKSVTGEDSEEGEIVIYGNTVMVGYHNLPEQTADTMTEDGGFKTGDLGKFDQDGFLYISGRIKEQYKLENGKYVVPTPMEEKLKLSPYIGNVMLYGDNRLYNIAVLQPEFPMLEQYASDNGIPGSGKELLENQQVIDLFQQEIDHYSSSFKGYEKPKKFYLSSEEWAIDNGLLTPTLKLKRRIVIDKYKEQIDGLY